MIFFSEEWGETPRTIIWYEFIGFFRWQHCSWRRFEISDRC